MTYHQTIIHWVLVGSFKSSTRRALGFAERSTARKSMKKIAIIWEMGHAFGHIIRLHKLAKAFSDKGYDVTFILENPNLIPKYFPSEGSQAYTTLSSPRIEYQKLKASRRPGNYSEILLSTIFYHKEIIESGVGKWREIIQSIKPDLIIYDASPTAMLASRDIDTRKVNLGDGFFSPPTTSPLPAFHMQPMTPDAQLKISEKTVIKNINDALTSLNISPIEYVHNIYDCDDNILLSFQELDIYAQYRKNVTYHGAISNDKFASHTCSWPNTNNLKILSYLPPSHPGLENILSAIKKTQAYAHLFIPGYKHRGDNKIKISSIPFNIRESIKEADLFITHGGHTSVATALLSGTPSLISPCNQEQFLTAQICIDNSLGNGINPFTDIDTIKKKIIDTSKDEGIKQSVANTSKKYNHYNSETTTDHIINLCEALLH